MAGYIEDRIWNNWKEGIEYAFSKKAYRDAWDIIELDTYYYPDFTKWMKDVILETRTSLAGNQ